MLHEALSVCCYSCTTIRFLKPYVTTADGVALYTSSTMMMPFVTAATSKLTVGDIFVGAIPTKGVIYITNEDVSMVHFNRFATSISSNWPLFCISLLLAIDAGIIVWLLVSRRSAQRQFWSFSCKLLFPQFIQRLEQEGGYLLSRHAYYEPPPCINALLCS